MLVFNIKLRSNKTSFNRRISAITTALFFRNVETKFDVSTSGTKGVCPREHIQILCRLKLKRKNG